LKRENADLRRQLERLESLDVDYAMACNRLAALREAALWLTKSCRDRLPERQIDKIDEEIRKVESLAKQEKP
jgi:hypothetical protein